MPTVIEWVHRLDEKVDAQERYAGPFEKRYRNEHVLPFIEQEYREVYGGKVDQLLSALDAPRTGTAAIGIDALTERLTVLGGSSDDRAAARLVDDAWIDNDLDVMHREAHREALIKARAFGQVARSDDGKAVVSIEAPEQMAVYRQQAPPYNVTAAWKRWTDDWTGRTKGRLQLPGWEVDLDFTDDMHRDPEGSDKLTRWVATEARRPTRLSGVPVVEFACRPRLLAEPVSDIAPIATLVDIVDLVEGLMVFAGHFGAVPIRYATGITVMRDPKDPSKPLLGPDGKPLIGFNPRADHMWVSTSKDATFGQLEPAGLASFIAWAEHASSRVRAKTAVASTYYSLDLKSHMSAELLKTDEAPMVRRVTSMGQDGHFGQAWRRVLQWVLTIEDPSSRARVQPRWADPNTRVEAQATDSFQKAVASGIGVKVAAEKYLGWDPDTIDRAVQEYEDQQRRLAQNDVVGQLLKFEPTASAGADAELSA